MTYHRKGPRRRRLAGSLSVELLLILPILMALMLGMFRFGLELHARQRLQVACRDAARVAALGGDRLDVEHAAARSLGDGRLAEAEVLAVLEDEDGGPLPSGESVMVEVRLATIRVVPDLLRFVGISHANDVMAASVAMRKE